MIRHAVFVSLLGSFWAGPAVTEEVGPKPDSGPKPGSYRLLRNVHYSNPESGPLWADIYAPAGKGPFPGVLMIHGGGWRAGSKVHMLPHARELAERDYVVMSINYRLAPAHKFPAQIHDCKAAVRWLKEHAPDYHLDSHRLAAYGYSAGGHLACLLGMTDPSDGLEGIDHPEQAPSTRVQAVVAGGAPCDFRNLPAGSEVLAYWLEGKRAAHPARYTQASPIAAVSPDDPPTFLFHGEKDWLVPLHSPQRMVRRLEQDQVRTEIYICQGKGHVGAFLDPAARERSVAFLDDVLKSSLESPVP